MTSGHHGEAAARHVSRIYVSMVLAALVAAAGITVIYNMLATLYRSFPDQQNVGWVVTIYWLASGVVAAVCGRLGDVLGRRRVLLVVLVLCTVGSALSGLSETLAILIAGCAIQGIAAAISPLSYGVLRENLPPEQMPTAIGVMVAAGMIGSGVIYLLSGIVIDQFSWQGGFWFKVVLAWGSLVVWHANFNVFLLQALFCSIGLTLAQGGIYSVIMKATPAVATAEATGLT